MFVVVAAITVVSCFLKGRRKDRKRDKEQASSQVGKEIKEDLVFVGSFSNPAFAASSSDLNTSEGLRHEIWPFREL